MDPARRLHHACRLLGTCHFAAQGFAALTFDPLTGLPYLGSTQRSRLRLGTASRRAAQADQAPQVRLCRPRRREQGCRVLRQNSGNHEGRGTRLAPPPLHAVACAVLALACRRLAGARDALSFQHGQAGFGGDGAILCAPIPPISHMFKADRPIAQSSSRMGSARTASLASLPRSSTTASTRTSAILRLA